MLSSNLEKTLREAYNLASTHNHEFVTLEHLLYALTDDKDFIPYVGIENGAAATEELLVHFTAMSRILFE